MTTPFAFPDTTPNFGLPLLFAGQAQKEFTLNQSVSLIDAITRGVVAESRTEPPMGAVSGTCFRILPDATGDWAGRDGEIALRIGGGWQFLTPFTGLRVYDQTARSICYFDAGWHKVEQPVLPQGGDTVDVEVRAALQQLIEALRTIGIMPAQS